MKIVGLITEYNPFHNGHQYHIEQAKDVTGADAAIVVMSGNFVQRGAPAMIPKHLRAECALKCGADLVIELPCPYATGTAEQFAYGAVSLLDKIGCVDSICFGSECGEMTPLQELAHILTTEPPAYRKALQQNLRAGMSFPSARQATLELLYPDSHYDKLLEQPNNILGIEYLKALSRLNSKMTPFTIPRISSHYHDTELQETFSSASALRRMIAIGDFAGLYGQIPPDSMISLEDHYQKRYPICSNDFSLLLKYKLLNETKESLTRFADVSEELANRICNQRNSYSDYEQFCELLKTKELTYTRISRALLHVLLDVKKTDYTQIGYARILGFQKASAEIFSDLKKQSTIPLVTRLTADNTLSDSAKNMLAIDIYVSNLYESVVTDKFKTSFINEYKHQVVRI